MRSQRAVLFSLTALAVCLLASSGHSATVTIATSKGVGADAEVRDHQPTTNFGASTELATRILDDQPLGGANDGNDRFSAMYLKFDITGLTIPPTGTSLRLTYRNTNLTPNRVSDTTAGANDTDFRTGLAFYGLDRDHAGNSWSEATITYQTAPGMDTPGPGGDFNNGTKDLNTTDPDGAGALRRPLAPLGVKVFPAVPPQNHLPVGGELVFTSTELNNFVTAAINAGKSTVTIVACIAHDGKIPVNDWKNFNYLFNPKEMTTLNADTAYDPDTTDANPAGAGPFSSASNATDGSGFSPFSPQLILAGVPEPSSVGLACLALASLAAWRRR
jgi:hypothetical protein